MTDASVVFVTAFLATAVEAIEMVTIVVAVGVTRGYRATLVGVAAGLVVLVVTVAIGGLALAAVPIGPLRLDYGIPINNDKFNSGSGRFQFGVGYRREF